MKYFYLGIIFSPNKSTASSLPCPLWGRGASVRYHLTRRQGQVPESGPRGSLRTIGGPSAFRARAPLAANSFFFVSTSLFLFCSFVYLFLFFRFPPQVKSYGICFPLPDLFRLASHPLGSFTLLHVVRFPSILLLRNTVLHVCTCPLGPFIHRWASGLLRDLGCSQQCCGKHKGVYVFLH